MTPNTRDLKSVFVQALEQSPGLARTTYLDGVCRGDDQLRSRVEALLDFYLRTSTTHRSAADVEAGDASPDGATHLADEGTTTFTPGSPTDAGPIADGPGTRIGPYLLLQKIGEGGMGTVYMAEQSHPIRRKIALKVIKPGMDSARSSPASRPSGRRWR